MNGGLSLVMVRRLLIEVASLVAEHGLWVVFRLHWLTVCGIFLDQGLNLVPCIGRRILNRWTAREVPFWVNFRFGEMLNYQANDTLNSQALEA